MATHVCPWWGGYFIDNRLRRLLHKPERLLADYVRPGMTVLDVGCGMGFFSIAMAKMVGSEGRVVAVDVQPQMLRTLEARAKKAGVADRIRTHLCTPRELGVNDAVEFALAFAMVHEHPDQRKLLGDVYTLLAAGGRLFVAEPRGHVPAKDFGTMVDTAESLGFKTAEQPHVRWCHAVVLARPAADSKVRD